MQKSTLAADRNKRNDDGSLSLRCSPELLEEMNLFLGIKKDDEFGNQLVLHWCNYFYKKHIVSTQPLVIRSHLESIIARIYQDSDYASQFCKRRIGKAVEAFTGEPSRSLYISLYKKLLKGVLGESIDAKEAAKITKSLEKAEQGALIDLYNRLKKGEPFLERSHYYDEVYAFRVNTHCGKNKDKVLQQLKQCIECIETQNDPFLK